MKREWQYTNSKLKTRTGIPNLRKGDGNQDLGLTIYDKEKAEALANYFCKVFTKEPDINVPAVNFKPVIKSFGSIKVKTLLNSNSSL